MLICYNTVIIAENPESSLKKCLFNRDLTIFHRLFIKSSPVLIRRTVRVCFFFWQYYPSKGRCFADYLFTKDTFLFACFMIC